VPHARESPGTAPRADCPDRAQLEMQQSVGVQSYRTSIAVIGVITITHLLPDPHSASRVGRGQEGGSTKLREACWLTPILGSSCSLSTSLFRRHVFPLSGTATRPICTFMTCNMVTCPSQLRYESLSDASASSSPSTDTRRPLTASSTSGTRLSMNSRLRPTSVTVLWSLPHRG
jgi:hypothetical protein